MGSLRRSGRRLRLNRFPSEELLWLSNEIERRVLYQASVAFQSLIHSSTTICLFSSFFSRRSFRIGRLRARQSDSSLARSLIEFSCIRFTLTRRSSVGFRFICFLLSFESWYTYTNLLAKSAGCRRGRLLIWRARLVEIGRASCRERV